MYLSRIIKVILCDTEGVNFETTSDPSLIVSVKTWFVTKLTIFKLVIFNFHLQSSCSSTIKALELFIHFTQAMIKSLLDYVKQVLCKGGEDAEGHVEVHPNSAKEGKASGRLKTNIF